MAIDWKLELHPKNQKHNNYMQHDKTEGKAVLVESGKISTHYSVVAKRFNTDKPDIILNTITVKDVILDTKEQQDALWLHIIKKYEKQKAEQSSIDSIVSAGVAVLKEMEKSDGN